MDYVPERIIKADNLLNSILVVLNIAIPIIYAILVAITNYIEITQRKKPFLIQLIARSFNVLAVIL
jgi:hypothetical protein